MNADKKEIIKIVGSNKESRYFEYAKLVGNLLPVELHEQLRQLINGPIWDGDIICKSHRDELFEYGLAIRVCVKGEQGFTGATYFAYSIMKTVNES